jgi:hypothetical protein
MQLLVPRRIFSLAVSQLSRSRLLFMSHDPFHIMVIFFMVCNVATLFSSSKHSGLGCVAANVAAIVPMARVFSLDLGYERSGAWDIRSTAATHANNAQLTYM